LEALRNACVLSDGAFLESHTVIIDGGLIKSIEPDGAQYDGLSNVVDIGGNYLLPGFVDLQVNGGGGVLFNDEPSVDTIRRIGEAHRFFGTTSFMPTLITDEARVMERAILAVREAIEIGVPGVLGIHLEGPYLNPEKCGAHDAGNFRTLDLAAVDLLSSLDLGRTLVTLAPEMTNPELIASLRSRNVVVSAGHTNAGFKCIQEAFDAGVTGVTHLFNAMSNITAREPGVVGAALDNDELWCGIIIDGFHVDPACLRLAMAAKPISRLFLVTDAMPGVGTDMKAFNLNGESVTIEGGKCVNSDGTLAGSNLDMSSAVTNAVQMMGVTLAQAISMASQNPAEFIGLGETLGQIKAGYRADLIMADRSLNILKTWIAGVPKSAS